MAFSRVAWPRAWPNINKALSSEEEGDPGRGGRQGTTPRAEQLGGPASRGLQGCFGLSPYTSDHP
eukprot:2791866-Pyramimonas_sp.AAC.1